MKVGDLVIPKKRSLTVMQIESLRMKNTGIIVERRGRDIAYVCWAGGKVSPISIRLLRRVTNDC